MPRTDHDPQRPPAKDDPERFLLPSFQAPSPASPEEPTAEPDSPPAPNLRTEEGRSYLPVRLGSPSRGGASGSLEFGDRPASDQTGRTGTSTGGDDDLGEAPKVTRAEVVALLAGILAVVGTAANLVVRWQMKRQLRQPNKRQRREIAAPAARILMRRADLAKLAPDLGDALDLAAAAGAYLGDGPLLQPLHHTADAGLPADLQEIDE